MRGFGARTAPEETIRAIQEVDPDAHLLHLGGNEWLLGIRRENPGARERIHKQLKALDARKDTTPWAGREFQLLQLYAYGLPGDTGFQPIMMYELGAEDPDGETITFGWIVEDFRVRDFNWRVRPKAAEKELMDAISLDVQDRKRTEVIREFVDAEGPSLFRHVFKRARSFVQRVALPTGG